MAEVDIDKILEQSEKAEVKKEIKSKAVLVGVIAGSVVVLGVIAVILMIVLKGTPAETYFPVRHDMKFTFNVQNGYPELWTFPDKKETVGGYECVILNKADQVKYSQIQEYYNYSKDGILFVGYSRDYGKKKRVMLKMLPGKIKKGAVFQAGMIGKTEVKGTIGEKEMLNTPSGEMEAIRVDYKGGEVMDKSIWYAKDFGIVKVYDKKNGVRTDLIASENR